MSRWKQLAADVRAAGDIHRQSWEPGKASLKVYQWWCEQRNYRIADENFCHYWRVVLIWAPLLWLIKPALWIIGLTAIGAIIWTCVVFTGTVLQFVGTVLAAVVVVGYLALCVHMFQQVMHELGNHEFDGPWRWVDKKTGAIKGLLTLLTLPALIVFMVVLAFAISLIVIVRSLENDYAVFSGTKNWVMNYQFTNKYRLSWIRPWHAVPLALLVLSIPYEPVRFVLRIVIAIALFMAFMGGLALLNEVTRNRSKMRRASMPVSSSDDETPYVKKTSVINRRLRTMATTVSEILSLIWSAILAKKWRICPRVIIPQ